VFWPLVNQEVLFVSFFHAITFRERVWEFFPVKVGWNCREGGKVGSFLHPSQHTAHHFREWLMAIL